MWRDIMCHVVIRCVLDWVLDKGLYWVLYCVLDWVLGVGVRLCVRCGVLFCVML